MGTMQMQSIAVTVIRPVWHQASKEKLKTSIIIQPMIHDYSLYMCMSVLATANKCIFKYEFVVVKFVVVLV